MITVGELQAVLAGRPVSQGVFLQIRRPPDPLPAGTALVEVLDQPGAVLGADGAETNPLGVVIYAEPWVIQAPEPKPTGCAQHSIRWYTGGACERCGAVRGR